ncbi:TITAN-like protein [Chenopodium quinoa]|uniref:TITAN-like protein n=1 Tax=Chenopodium quinoa TaxID=63459 RepID=UPI000B78A5AF|nr:TITAN-like protein [Chenopodium quinoa]XP_021775881.1 TITAN-like protein [Chenopodium quinoa]
MKRDRDEKKMKKKVDDKPSEYEFCKLCRINHNQGRRHNFFPRHTNSLSSLFTRFHQKLSIVKSSLRNPSFVLSSSDSPDHLWCIFCDSDIVESDSAFVCGNLIEHLASEDHLKNLKHFLWKYGGGMNKVDSFRITEDELAEWKKRCAVLKKDAPPSRSSHGQSNDIQTNYEIINTSNINNIPFLESRLSKDVMPLQYATNENYQVYHSDISQAGEVSSSAHDLASHTTWTPEHHMETQSLTCMSQSRQQPLVSSMKDFFADALVKTRVCQKQSIASREPFTEGYHSLSRISCEGMDVKNENVHSGARPPWLEGFEACNEHEQSRGPKVNVTEKNSKKTNKLNPKRVGAAWAEKRKLELEMEKRGEIIANSSDANWLPNFGGVWQSGSRKESMKGFKKEKLNVPKAESKVESETKLHPYISKRMRQGTNDNSEDVQKTGDLC